MGTEGPVQTDNTIHILHIEDDKDLAVAMSRILRRSLGPEVSVKLVSSGEECRAVIGDRSWSVIISDWDILGHETGGDLYNMVRDSYPSLCARYIFVSGNPEAGLLATAVGAVHFPKPFEPDRLVKAVTNILWQG
jgi:DNA-binding NtrC family response regulator